MNELMKRNKELATYTFVISTTDKNYITWGTDYKYDMDSEVVQVLNDYGHVCYTINMTDLDFVRLDIYDAHKSSDRPIQTYLRKPEVVVYA